MDELYLQIMVFAYLCGVCPFPGRPSTGIALEKTRCAGMVRRVRWQQKHLGEKTQSWGSCNLNGLVEANSSTRAPSRG